MRITNKFNLPDALVKAVENDPYSKGQADISITELLKPVQMRFLEKKHWEELEEDASDRLWSLYGQIVHGILERAETVAIPEKRWTIEVEGWKVSGGVDRLLLADGLLQDYKFTNTEKFGKTQSEWLWQLNCYAELIRQNLPGSEITKLEIILLFRDWKKGFAVRDPSYPQQSVVKVPISLLPSEEVKKFIAERVKAHKEAKVLHCTKEERWEKECCWAIRKDGQGRATKLHFNKEDAEKDLASRDAKSYYIQERTGQSTRCEHYCSVAKFCNQYQTSKKGKKN